MEIVYPELQAVKERFPEQAVRIEKLYIADRDFRSLCSDYLLSIQTLQKFEKQFNNKLNAVKEYQDVCTVLEKEINDFIAEK